MEQQKKAQGRVQPMITVEDICDRLCQSRRYIIHKFKTGYIQGTPISTRKVNGFRIESACDWVITNAEFRRICGSEGLITKVCEPEDNGVITEESAREMEAAA